MESKDNVSSVGTLLFVFGVISFFVFHMVS